MRIILKHTVPLILGLTILATASPAQEINFGKYADDDIVITQLTPPTNLDFGFVLSNQGLVQINLGDPEMVVFSIEGNAQLDVFVSITAPPDLVLDAGNKIPYTLQAAYANRGDNDISEAVIMSGNSVRFPLKKREQGPARPPPTPRHEGYTPPRATAYLYIYGSINVGDVAAGTYTGTIDIIVDYEQTN